jgi:uncharacterized protein (DUF697 family)
MGLDDMFNGFKAKNYTTEAERESAASSLTQMCGYAAAALTIIPIPGTELFAVTAIHVGMVVAIGHIYGSTITKDNAAKILVRIGAAAGMSIVSRVATTVAKTFVPIIGGLIGAPFMFASTLAIGMVARLYFQSEGNVSDDDMKAVYEQALKNAKRSFDPKKARAPEAQSMASEAATAAKKDPAMAAAVAAVAPAGPPEDVVTRLERLKALKDKGLIDGDEFEAAKKKVLAEI